MAKQFFEMSLVEKKSFVQTLLEGKPYPHVKHEIEMSTSEPRNCRVIRKLSSESPSTFYQLILELEPQEARIPFVFLDYEHQMCIMMYGYNLLDLLHCEGHVVVKDGKGYKRSEFSDDYNYNMKGPLYKILPLDVDIHTAPVSTAIYSKKVPYTLEELMAIEKVKLPASAPEELFQFVDGIKCFMDCLFVLFCEKEGYEDPHLDCLSVAKEKVLICALTGHFNSVMNLIEKKNVDFCNNRVFRNYVLARYTQISDQKSEKTTQTFSNPLTPTSQPVPDLKSEKTTQTFSNPLTPTSQPVPDSSYMESQDRQMLPPQRQTLYPSLYDAPGYHQMSATHMSQAPGYHQMCTPQMTQAPGYHQMFSDGQPIYSPFVPLTSGFHQISSPFGQQASGFYQISSPFEQYASHAQQEASCRQQGFALPQQMSSPFGQHASHAQQMSSPSQQMSSPSQQGLTLPQQMSSPFGQQASPVQPHASPFGQQASPVQPHASPFGQQASPVQPHASHAQQMSSPFGQQASPVQQMSSHVQQMSSPSQQMSSPSQQGFALPQQNSPCHQEEANLFKELFPHQILSKASKMQQSTQAVDWSPFDHKFSPDLCLKKNPTTQMLQEKSPFWQDKASLLPQMSTPCVPQSSPVSEEAFPLPQMSTPCVPQPPPFPPMLTPYVPQASPVQNTSSFLQKDSSCHQEPVSSPRLSSDIFQTSRGKKPVEDSESEDDDNTSEESFYTVITAPTMSQKNKKVSWSEQCDEQVEKIEKQNRENVSSPQQGFALPQQRASMPQQGFALPQQQASLPQQMETSSGKKASSPGQMSTSFEQKASFYHQHLDEDLADPYTYQPMSCRCMEMFIREVQAFPVETVPKHKLYIYQAIKLLQDNKSNVPFRYDPKDKDEKILVALLATVLSGANSSCPQHYRFHKNKTMSSFCKKLGIEKDPFVIFLHNSIVSLTVDVEQEAKEQFSFFQIFTLVLEKLNKFQKKVKTILDAFFPILETNSMFLEAISAYREAESEYLGDRPLETSNLFHFGRIKKTGHDNKNIVPVYPLSAEKIFPKKMKASAELKETRRLGMSHGNLKDAHQKYQLCLEESYQHQVWIRQQEASCRQQKDSMSQQEASCRQQGFALQQQRASTPQQGFALQQQRASMSQQMVTSSGQITSRREQRASYHQEQASRYQKSSSPYYQDLSRYHQDLSNYHQEVTAKEQQPLRRKKQAPLPPQQASSSQQQVPPKEKQASSSQQQVPPKEEQASTSQEQAPPCEKPVAQKKPPGNQQTHLSTSKGSHPLFTGSHPAVPKKSVTSSGQPASPEETLVTSSSPQVSIASTSQQDVSSSSPVDPNP